MATVYVDSKLKATFDDNTTTDYKLPVSTFFITGDKLKDLKGNDIITAAILISITSLSWIVQYQPLRASFSLDCPDGSSLLTS